MTHVRADALAADRALLTAGTELAKKERDFLAAIICEREADAASRYGVLDIVVPRMRPLQGRVAVGEDRTNTA